MITLPASTDFNRRVPKQKFYDNLSVTPRLKKAFTEQISQIIWRNKIAPATVNLAVGQTVKEIEVFTIRLNQPGLDTGLLPLIDKAIPYHLLFLLEHADKTQAWIGYKETSRNRDGARKPETYYHTAWTPSERVILHLDGLSLDTVYENLIRQVAGERLQSDAATDLREAISLDKQREKLHKEITTLERKIRQEKQFNRQVELNAELRRLKASIKA